MLSKLEAMSSSLATVKSPTKTKIMMIIKDTQVISDEIYKVSILTQ
jgi:hypothetical protein